MNRFGRCLVLVALWVSCAAHAVIETYEFSEPQLEERYRQLSAELRCPKCQNQNIADSNAPIAQDLRKRLHQQLEAGASDQQILEDMVNRYGEFVRYRPRFGGATLVLWLAPLLLLCAAALVVYATLRRRPAADTETQAALTDDEEARLKALLNEGESGP